MSSHSPSAEAPACRQDRILFLGKRFYTNKDALTERFGRVYRLPLGWAMAGHRVLLWLVDYHTRKPANESIGLLRIFSTPAFSLSPVTVFVALFRLRPNIVVASGDCYIGWVGWLLARLFGASFVFDIYDKYDEFAGYRRFLGFDLFAFLRKRSQLNFFCSRALMEFYSAKDATLPVCVVANGVDDAAFVPMPMQECRGLLGLSDSDVLIGYFGSMEPDRGVSDLVGAVEILRREGQIVRLLICGTANPEIPLNRDWITFRGMVPHADIPYYLNASDLLVLPYRESTIMDMSASCKIAEYVMCKRPIVSTRTANFVTNFPLQASELGAGVCQPGNSRSLASSIRNQLSERRIVTSPTDMSWNLIAAAALVAMQARVETSA